MTQRRYQDDSYATEFESGVVSVLKHGDEYATVLEGTLFYPESGGQPCDTGSIEGLTIESVIEQDGDILHISSAGPPFGPGDTVRAKIDWARRFTNMQQHTGQHILSQAFVSVLDAKTVSSRLGTGHSTVDVSKLDLTWDDMEKVERLSNSIVFENREVRVYEAKAGEVSGLRVKQDPARDLLRIVEVDGFDKSPCGGTHCRMTGEVGLIKILRWEKVRDATRAEFLCGALAEADYFWKSRFIVDLAQRQTTKDTGIPAQVFDLYDSHKDLRRQVESLRAELLEYEIAEIETRAREISGTRVVSAYLDGSSAADIKDMALRLTGKGNTVALLASGKDRVHLVFSRSEDVPADMRKLIAVACELVDGRGGGKPAVCQGGGSDPGRVHEALEESERLLDIQLRERDT
ncbi:MAG: DHHA1 domain-containing protein [Candidatus Eisenbacteria bacterium]